MSHFIKHRVVSFCVVLSLFVFQLEAFSSQTFRGFVEDPTAENRALLVGVSHGLPGLDIDIDNLKKMATHASYQFEPVVLMDEQGTSDGIAAELTSLSGKVDGTGTFFFYFTGHGNVGVVLPQDGEMKIEAIRDAIEAGRESVGPLARLVMIFDSCHSGSLLDPIDRDYLNPGRSNRAHTEAFADEVVRVMTRGGIDRSSYWKKLLVMASTKPDETCLASPEGSYYSNSLKRAFDVAIKKNSTIGEFIDDTREGTYGSTPTARLVPADLANELMRP